MRGKGEGSVYKRADGYWVGQVEVGRKNGVRRYARVVRRRKADVLASLGELRTNARDGVVVDRTRTVAAFLTWWLDNVAASQVSESSLLEYRKRVKRIIPHVGHIRLGKLATTDLQSLSVALSAQYSTKTARTTMETLRGALRWAVGAQILARNPADYVHPSRVEEAVTDDTLSAEEAAAILEAARGTELEALWWLALKYGMRMSELLNLRWSDIDFKKRELHVRKSKTAAGVRTLPLIDEAVRILQAHRSNQEVTPLDGLLFPSPTLEGARSAAGIRLIWSDLLRAAEVDHKCRNCESAKKCTKTVRRFHCSRHTAATLLLENGVALEVVSAILGHSSIGITAGVYAKVRADLKRKALESVG